MKKITTHIITLLMACFSLGSIAFTGCSKDKTNTTSAENYQINNITDQTIAQGGTTTAAWEVKLSGSSQAQVAVAISGLPSGITATITPTTGIPTFNTTVVFAVDASMAPGTYAYTVTATSSVGNKTYTSHIVVTAVPQCTTTVAGLYIDNSSSPADSIQISPVAGHINRVSIGYYFQGAATDSIYADLYCTQDSLDIPLQIRPDGFGSTYTVSGHGSFSTTNITLTENISTIGFPYTETFQKH